MTVTKLFALAIALVVVAPLVARADPAPTTFEVHDRGQSVEVVAHNVKAARTAVLPLRARLQVPVTGTPMARRATPGDATVRLIEFDSEDASRVLSIKLNLAYGDVKTLSRFAQAIQVGDDLHVLIPRKVPDSGTVPRLPEPTLPPALAAAVARLDAALPGLAPRHDANALRPVGNPRTEPTTGGNADAKPDSKTTKGDPKVEMTSEANTDAKPAGADAKPDPKIPATTETKTDARLDAHAVKAGGSPEATAARAGAAAGNSMGAADPLLGPQLPPPSEPPRPEAPARPEHEPTLHPALAADSDDLWSRISTFAAVGVGAAGIGLWLMRRRRTMLPPHATIDVIAQRSLGARARVVWLSAGPREMIVSVTAQQIRVLGQWRKTDAGPARPTAHSQSERRIEPPALGDGDAVPTPLARGTADFSSPVPTPVSPAVNGILRLRGRTGQMPAAAPLVSDDVATGDVVADEQWAKEILAATTEPRR